jgi:hypothetical protein
VHRVSLEQGGSVDYGRRGRRYLLSAHGTNGFVILERPHLVQPLRGHGDGRQQDVAEQVAQQWLHQDRVLSLQPLAVAQAEPNDTHEVRQHATAFAALFDQDRHEPIRVGIILQSLVARQVHGSGTGIGHGQAGQAQAGIVVAVGNTLHLPLPQVLRALGKQQGVVAATIDDATAAIRAAANSSNHCVSQKFCASYNMGEFGMMALYSRCLTATNRLRSSTTCSLAALV